ncbi:PD-(D/E)XK nuclease family protein [Olsenella massiliensis]|uniref:PD-(D/E)XK nuclease family protein n=1 Tax=Olsenella massiliensis TaxID=1622075 RepID=UPI00071CF616|nr:PD-(D/E)XK nuclease family protein [Olsenella massiliensis]
MVRWGGRDELSLRRLAFASLVRLPRRHLALERSLRDGTLKERWPSVMLTELVSCYGAQDAGDVGTSLEVLTLDESHAEANCSPSGRASRFVGTEALAASGHVSARLQGQVVVPNEGSDRLPHGRPLLSASQLESYLECPYKWFSLRRLGLQESDAGFTSMEMGTFAHRVLEVTHRSLLEEARQRLLASRGLDPLCELPLTERMGASRVREGDDAALRHAQQILLDEFELHLRHQFLSRGRRARSQALVAHDATDEGQIEALRQDLLSTLEYESGLFVGFEPRLFEWGFGRDGELVDYAGCYLQGTVDRVDVDAHGQAVVIDYKHRSPGSFVGEYGVFDKGGPNEGEPFALPRRVQSLIYAQVVRRRYPDLRIAGAVYLGSKGAHALAGAVAANLADRVFGSRAPAASALASMCVPEDLSFGQDGRRGLSALLDATEDAIAEKVRELMAGRIEADPVDDAACQYCPVMNCDKRRSS